MCCNRGHVIFIKQAIFQVFIVPSETVTEREGVPKGGNLTLIVSIFTDAFVIECLFPATNMLMMLKMRVIKHYFFSFFLQ